MVRDSALQLCSNDMELKKILMQFIVSKGWLVNFVKFHSLRTASLSAKGNSASVQEVAKRHG